MSRKFVPSISVIVPMYNSEKYIAECLHSIFSQTFQDFEIIVVDNCSTDKSCEVVQKYVKNFGEKIKLIRRKNNSGSGAEPRNLGVRFALGKYIIFIDSDDLVTKTAFEELYNVAEKFDADVVYRERYFVFDNLEEKKLKVAHGWDFEYNFVKTPTLTSNLEERLKDFNSYKYWVTVWSYFIRRDLILENNIGRVGKLRK